MNSFMVDCLAILILNQILFIKKVLDLVKNFNNFDRIKEAIENKFTVNHVVDGQKGLAKFMVDTILTDEEGNLLYVCTDASRNIFKASKRVASCTH